MSPEGSLIPFVDLASQQVAIKDELDRRIAAVLAHGKYIMGPEVAELEEVLARYTGARHCISVASGTDALLIGLMALGIGPGDEVIVPAFTFAASAEVVFLVGATPVLVDVEPDTCNVDVRALESAVTDKTKAIMPVSLYGQPSDMAEINALAERHGLKVMEDGAQSFGADYGDRKSCALSHVGCTSFFPSKPLGCYGDGGAIFTDDEALAQACREIRVHGQSNRYHHSRLGVAGRMDTLQCAIVLAKLTRFEWEMARRAAIGRRYNELFDNQGIQRVVQRGNRTSAFAQYTVFVDDRSEVQRRLQEAGIPTAVHYPAPLNEQPAYAGSRHGPLSNSEQLSRRVLSLPMHAYLSEEIQDRIADTVAEAVTVA